MPLRDTHHRRIVLLALMALMGFGIVVTRLAHISVMRGDHYRRRADRQHYGTTHYTPRRGDILDRDGRPLAISVMRETLYVNTQATTEEMRDEIAETCEEIFSRPAERYRARLNSESAPKYVPLERRMSPEQADLVRAMIRSLRLGSTDWVFLKPETKRLYPMDSLASHMLGFTRPDDTGDNEGVTGIEATWNSYLRGQAASGEAFQNAARQAMEPLGPEALIASAGNQIYLTIDSVLQGVAEEALAESVERYEADWGAAVVLDPQTGEILALANCPTFDLNSHGSFPEESKRNHALMSPVDPGSVMKIFTFAAAMEDGLIDEDEMIDCHGGSWYHDQWRRRIRDDTSHRIEVVPLRQAFALSSNIATVQVADRVGAEGLVEQYRAFGFGNPTGITLPAEHPGSLRPARSWSLPDHVSIPIGQGMTMTALQAASALGAIANGGVWIQPHVVLRVEDLGGRIVDANQEIARRRVISSLTARRMAAMMEEVVSTGTGDDAQIAGYRVAGKTGTADRYDEEAGCYQGYIACFAGFAPVEDPQFVCVVFVSNPNRQIGFYGGTVAGSVFREIMENALRIHGVSPDSQSAPAETAAEVVIESAAHTVSSLPGNALNLPGQSLMMNQMPDLTGLTMREVVRRLGACNATLRFQGTGVVTSQVPLPGTSLDDVTRVVVMFEEGSAAGGLSDG